MTRRTKFEKEDELSVDPSLCEGMKKVVLDENSDQTALCAALSYFNQLYNQNDNKLEEEEEEGECQQIPEELLMFTPKLITQAMKLYNKYKASKEKIEIEICLSALKAISSAVQHPVPDFTCLTESVNNFSTF